MRIKLEALVDERTEELRVKSLELERQATHDTLTGLFNRRYADNYLNKEIEISKRNDRPCTIALADIDHFNQINDQCSHAVGDKVLCRIAEIFVDRCRTTDVVARYGGDEFLLCFPDTGAVFAEQICSQIRTTIEKEDWSMIATGIKTTVSFGIARSWDGLASNRRSKRCRLTPISSKEQRQESCCWITAKKRRRLDGNARLKHLTWTRLLIIW